MKTPYVKPFKTPYRNPTTKFMGDTPASVDEMEALRRKAWTEQGVLMINLSDPCLTEAQRNVLYAIAEDRYGYGGVR
jgi:hypothetical protein